MVRFSRLMGKYRWSCSLVLRCVKKPTFEVRDCELEGILGMLFLNKFNLEIDHTTGATNIDGYSIPLVDHEAYTSNSRLEIVSNKALLRV